MDGKDVTVDFEAEKAGLLYRVSISAASHFLELAVTSSDTVSLRSDRTFQYSTRNKLYQASCFAAEKVPTPKTVFCSNADGGR